MQRLQDCLTDEVTHSRDRCDTLTSQLSGVIESLDEERVKFANKELRLEERIAQLEAQQDDSRPDLMPLQFGGAHDVIARPPARENLPPLQSVWHWLVLGRLLRFANIITLPLTSA